MALANAVPRAGVSAPRPRNEMPPPRIDIQQGWVQLERAVASDVPAR